eukprot:SAG25_NODE_1241_length_3517_cov_2.244587_2_plen_39_part_00
MGWLLRPIGFLAEGDLLWPVASERSSDALKSIATSVKP